MHDKLGMDCWQDLQCRQQIYRINDSCWNIILHTGYRSVSIILGKKQLYNQSLYLLTTYFPYHHSLLYSFKWSNFFVSLFLFLVHFVFTLPRSALHCAIYSIASHMAIDWIIHGFEYCVHSKVVVFMSGEELAEQEHSLSYK